MVAATVRVRKDIWELGDESNPWRDPAVLAYAHGVKAMKDLAQSRPDHPANWVNQAAIHEHQGGSLPGRLEDQCQHGGWFFLPWHRVYLYRFEQIIRSHLEPAVAREWALPYWNYSDDPDRRSLPPAFRTPEWPGGSDDNPLYALRRQRAPIDINAGRPLPRESVSWARAEAERWFSRSATGKTQGFGGGRTRGVFHHGSQGPAGSLEITPHGDVHVLVGGGGGLMSSFSTAALDPIFWLHHANLDRLWEVWLRAKPGRANPADDAWLRNSFELVDETGTRSRLRIADVLDIESQLSYTYSGLKPRAPARPPVAPGAEGLGAMPPDELPAELIGSAEEPVVLRGAEPVTADFSLSPSRRPQLEKVAAEPEAGHVYLNIEDVEGDANPGLVYGVYLNRASNERPDPGSPHYVGTLSFFGIESTQPDEEDEEAPHRLSYTYDITDNVASLESRGQWNPEHVQVGFEPVGVDAENRLEHDPAPVRIGRVSIFVD